RYRLAEGQRLPGRRAHPGGARAPAYAHRRDLRLRPGGAPPAIAAVRIRLSHREADRSAGSYRTSRLALVSPRPLRPGERRQLSTAKDGGVGSSHIPTGAVSTRLARGIIVSSTEGRHGSGV